MICIQCGISDCWCDVRKILYCNCQKGIIDCKCPDTPSVDLLYEKTKRLYNQSIIDKNEKKERDLEKIVVEIERCILLAASEGFLAIILPIEFKEFNYYNIESKFSKNHPTINMSVVDVGVKINFSNIVGVDVTDIDNYVKRVRKLCLS